MLPEQCRAQINLEEARTQRAEGNLALARGYITVAKSGRLNVHDNLQLRFEMVRIAHLQDDLFTMGQEIESIRKKCQEALCPKIPDQIAWFEDNIAKLVLDSSEHTVIELRPLPPKANKRSHLLSSHQPAFLPVGRYQIGTHTLYARPSIEGPTKIILKTQEAGKNAINIRITSPHRSRLYISPGKLGFVRRSRIPPSVVDALIELPSHHLQCKCAFDPENCQHARAGPPWYNFWRDWPAWAKWSLVGIGVSAAVATGVACHDGECLGDPKVINQINLRGMNP